MTALSELIENENVSAIHKGSSILTCVSAAALSRSPCIPQCRRLRNEGGTPPPPFGCQTSNVPRLSGGHTKILLNTDNYFKLLPALYCLEHPTQPRRIRRAGTVRHYFYRPELFPRRKTRSIRKTSRSLPNSV